MLMARHGAFEHRHEEHNVKDAAEHTDPAFAPDCHRA